MTMQRGVQLSNEKLSWFFTDPASLYELNEVVGLTQCSTDDIQNWVRRKIIKPDATTPGRRLYGPSTVATIAIAAYLRRGGVAANVAFLYAKIITDRALEWIAGHELAEGETPKFEKDFRQHYAVYFTGFPRPGAEPSEPGVELIPGVFTVSILHRSEIEKWFDAPHVSVLAIHWIWLGLAEFAREHKERRARRPSQDGAS